MKALILALLLLPVASAFPAVTFDGTLHLDVAEPSLVVIDGTTVLNGTGAIDLHVTDGSYDWSITTGNTTTTGNTIAFNASAAMATAAATATMQAMTQAEATQANATLALNAAIEQAVASILAGIDLATVEASIKQSVADAKITDYARKGDLAILDASLKTQLATQSTADEARATNLSEQVNGSKGVSGAALGLIILLFGAIVAREALTWRNRHREAARDQALAGIADALGITPPHQETEADAENEDYDGDETEEHNDAGVIVA